MGAAALSADAESLLRDLGVWMDFVAARTWQTHAAAAGKSALVSLEPLTAPTEGRGAASHSVAAPLDGLQEAAEGGLLDAPLLLATGLQAAEGGLLDARGELGGAWADGATRLLLEGLGLALLQEALQRGW